MKVAQRCAKIELILSDVDGVLTDGAIAYDNQGIELKRFHVRDGMGIKLWQRAGCHFGIVTSRNSHIVEVRAAEIGVELVRQGVSGKFSEVNAILAELKLTPEQLCYLGDDLPDLAVIKSAGLGVAVADASPEVRDAADYVTTAGGGQGAVRETIEMILKTQRRWDDLIKQYQ